MAKAKGETFGSGRPGDLADGFKRKETTLGAVPPNERSILDRSGPYSTKRQQTASLKGGLTIETTTDPYRVRGETASLKEGLLMGTTIHPYDGSSSPETQSGTSIFDPVLCELAYRWFCPVGGYILDPFAGGSVRGIVAAKLGRQYTGIDLRPEQAAANEEQAERICANDAIRPTWVVGDALDVLDIASGEYDFLFSCPPYADLEVYSDDPRDLSTMTYTDFLLAYEAIIASCLSLLKEDRFACFVVGDVRDPKTGFYRGFVRHTTDIFEKHGALLYNQAILVTAVGSLPIRVGRQFEAGRKLGTTHQHCLVFCNGDPRKATEACGDVETMTVEELNGLCTEENGNENNPQG